jgi:hypothetical protein
MSGSSLRMSSTSSSMFVLKSFRNFKFSGSGKVLFVEVKQIDGLGLWVAVALLVFQDDARRVVSEEEFL